MTQFSQELGRAFGVSRSGVRVWIAICIVLNIFFQMYGAASLGRDLATGGDYLGALPTKAVESMDGFRLTSGVVAHTPTDHKYRDNHRMLVTATDPRGVIDACGDDAIACASPATNEVFVPNPCLYPHEAYASLLCHEMAHLKGWEHEPDNKGWHEYEFGNAR